MLFACLLVYAFSFFLWLHTCLSDLPEGGFEETTAGVFQFADNGGHDHGRHHSVVLDVRTLSKIH